MKMIMRGGENLLPKTKETLKLVKKFTYVNNSMEIVNSAVVHKNYIAFPRNYEKLLHFIEVDEIVDERIDNLMIDPFNLISGFKLRDYQEKAVNEAIPLLREFYNVRLEAKTGSGKSFMLPAVVKELNQRTLILLDKKSLVEQMDKEFSNNTDRKPNILSAKNKEIKDVNITTFQFLHQNPELLEELADEIGLVVIDELQISSARTYRDILGKLRAKYCYSMSATHKRADGLTPILFDLLGNRLVKVETASAKAKIHLYKVKGNPQWEGNVFSQAFTNTITTPKFAEIVVNFIKQLRGDGRTIMFYMNNKYAMQYYSVMLEELGLKTGIISSDTKKDLRALYLEQIENGEIDVLIAGKIVEKGISIYKLDTIVNLATHNEVSAEQLIGRLLRLHPDKQEPLFIDFLFGGYLRNNSKNKVKIYKQQCLKYEHTYEMKENLPQFS